MPIKILLANDSARESFAIVDMLQEYVVLTVRDSLEAIHSINTNPDIGIIILDISSPNFDGFEFLKILNTSFRHRKLQSIIITSPDEPEKEIEGMKQGAIDYIRKPLRRESFKARMKMHLTLLKERSICDAILEQSPIGLAVSYGNKPASDEKADLVYINPTFEKILGRSRRELLSSGWAEFTHPADLKEDMDNYEKLMKGQIKSYSMEKRYIRPDGEVVWVDMVVAALYPHMGSEYNHISLIQDITQRKAAQTALLESERSKASILSHLPGLAYRCSYDNVSTMIFVSEGCEDFTGYPPKELLYKKDIYFRKIIAPEHQDRVRKAWRGALSEHLPFKDEYEIITASGERKWVLEMGQGVYDERGSITSFEGIILDISDRKGVEDALKYNIEHDSWTGLHNRRYLESILDCDSKISPIKNGALVCINLSSMQTLTMTYGFHYIEDFIKKVADLLKLNCGENHLLFRTYENRFVFYIKNYGDRSALQRFCIALLDSLKDILIPERIGCGIGILEINPAGAQNTDDLLKKLLIASEKAMDGHDGDFNLRFYDLALEAQIDREKRLIEELSQIADGRDDGGLFLKFQPILDLKTYRICGFEALARLRSNAYGIVSPLEFIPLAEKTKLIIALGRKIARLALSFLRELEENGYKNINISFNVSALELFKKDYPSHILSIVDELGVNPKSVCLEITESVFASDFDEINDLLENFRDRGMNVAIDDFGIGYSSLSRERELNVNCLKIDKFFIDKLATFRPDKVIAGDIISMAHKLGHEVVAEGVEHDRQRRHLYDFGCDKIQGYLISKPLDWQKAMGLLNKEIYS